MSAIHRVLVGPKTVLYINGQLIGRITDFTWTSNTPHKEIRGIDVTAPLELAPTTTSVGGSIALLRLSGDSGAQGAGLTLDQTNVSRQKYCTLILVDRSVDLPIFKTDYAMITSESWGASAKGYVKGSVSFEALIWNNEWPSPVG